MATWSETANAQMAQLKIRSGASDAAMAQLMSEISQWATKSLNGSARFELVAPKYPNGKVIAHVAHGVITNVSSG